MASAPLQPPAPVRLRLGDQLIQEGLINREQLARGLEEQKAFGGRLGRHLVDLGYLTDLQLLDALSRQLRIPRVDLDAPGVLQPDAARYARADLCEQWGFVPFVFDARRNVLLVAVSDPDPQLLADVQRFVTVRIEAQLAPQEAIDQAIRRLFHGEGSNQSVRQMQGLQVARAEKKRVDDGFNSPASIPPPAQPPPPTMPAAPAFDPQIAQQVALQQQLQAQLQQQLHLQQMQQLQLQAQQAAPYAPPMPPMGQMAPPMGPPPGQGYPPAGYPAAPGYPNYYPQDNRPPVPPQQQPPPAPTAPPPPAPPRELSPPPAASQPPSSRVAPMLPTPEAPSLEAIADQLNRLEKTLAAQARALRSLVEVLVDKGVLSKAEMARKQQEFGNK